MLLTGSTCIILFYTIYYRIKVHANKQILHAMTGKTVSMALGMVSSLAIGLILALALKGDLGTSTALAIPASLLVAWFISQPFGHLAVIEAAAASLMGSTMGAMLGEMLPANHAALSMISMDVIYLFSIFSILMIVKTEAAAQIDAAASSSTGRSYAFFLQMLIPFLLIGAATFLDNSHIIHTQPASVQSHHHMMNE